MKRRRRVRNNPALMSSIKVGATGAASLVVIDTVLSRIDLFATSPMLMALGRVAAGYALGEVAERAGASEEVSLGMAAGPVLFTTIDFGTRLLGKRRIDPPPAGDPGAPWAPMVLPR